jgi:large subunit ribosomal protein L7/L12
MSTVDSKISTLGDSLAALSLKDAVDLGKYMKETYGIEAAAGGGVMMAAGGGGGGAAKAEE